MSSNFANVLKKIHILNVILSFLSDLVTFFSACDYILMIFLVYVYANFF